MALYNTRAVVIGAANWREADRIITLFSRDKGKIKSAAYGCRHTKSRLASVSQLFSIVDVQLTAGQQIDVIKNCDHAGFLADFSADYTALAYASFVAEFVSEVFEAGQPQPQVYDKLLNIIPAMQHHNPRIAALAAFFQILEYTGSQLQYENCVVCGKKTIGDAFFSYKEGGVVCKDCSIDGKIEYQEKVREFILQLLQLDWTKPEPFHVQAKTLLAAENIMLEYVKFILEKHLKSLDFIKQIMR